jgi:hypothetical protein
VYNARIGGDPTYVASIRVIRGACKPCPHCGMDIQLQGGCDHVRCPSCHKDWCWRCGGKQVCVHVCGSEQLCWWLDHMPLLPCATDVRWSAVGVLRPAPLCTDDGHHDAQLRELQANVP